MKQLRPKMSFAASLVTALAGANVALGAAVALNVQSDDSSLAGRVWRAPCPPSCPGRVELDTDEATYTCCRRGLCSVCTDCPLLNPFC